MPHIHNKSHFIARAQENYAWILTSDVTFISEKEIGIGCTCIVDPLGNVVATGQALSENVITYQISTSTLDPHRSTLN